MGAASCTLDGLIAINVSIFRNNFTNVAAQRRLDTAHVSASVSM